MRRLTYPLAAGVVLSWLALQDAQPAFAQKKDNETVKIDTVDGVELKGTYWPGNKGKKSPVAILLHKLGGRSNEDGWKDLAEDLQKAGFAVLTFDFRGHGASTGVNPMTFWSFNHNKTGVKGFKLGAAKLPETIALADFSPRYLPHLVDDIAAARRFIERQNDNNDCNASNIVLIGAEDGATLGALWLSSETKRHRVIPVGLTGQKNDKAESKDVVACVWLNIASSIGLRNPVSVGGNLRTWLKEAGNTQVSTIPMVFLYGGMDKISDKAMFDLVKYIRPKYVRKKEKIDDNLPGTVDFPIAGTNLKGSKLIKEPGPREAIVKNYLEAFIFKPDKGVNEWEKRENNDVIYGWYFNPNPRVPPIYTNKKGEKNLAPIPLLQFGVTP